MATRTVAELFPWLIQPNPGEFMLQAAAANRGLGANFLRGVQMGQERKMVTEQFQMEINQAERAKQQQALMLQGMAGSKDPLQAVDFIQQNPHFLVDPATRDAAQTLLNAASTTHRIQSQSADAKIRMEKQKEILQLKERYGDFDEADSDQLKTYRSIDARKQFKGMLIDMGVDPNQLSAEELDAIPILPSGKLDTEEARQNALFFANRQGMDVTGANVTTEGGQMFLKQSGASGSSVSMSDRIKLLAEKNDIRNSFTMTPEQKQEAIAEIDALLNGSGNESPSQKTPSLGDALSDAFKQWKQNQPAR